MRAKTKPTNQFLGEIILRRIVIPIGTLGVFCCIGFWAFSSFRDEVKRRTEVYSNYVGSIVALNMMSDDLNANINSVYFLRWLSGSEQAVMFGEALDHAASLRVRQGAVLQDAFKFAPMSVNDFLGQRAKEVAPPELTATADVAFLGSSLNLERLLLDLESNMPNLFLTRMEITVEKPSPTQASRIKSQCAYSIFYANHRQVTP